MDRNDAVNPGVAEVIEANAVGEVAVQSNDDARAATLKKIAEDADKLAEAAKNKQAEEPRLSWIEEMKLLEPAESIEDEINGEKIVFAEPRAGVLFKALPALDASWRGLEPIFRAVAAGMAMESDVERKQFIVAMAGGWSLPKLIGEGGEGLLRVVEAFLGKPVGWAGDLRIGDLQRCVVNFLRVCPWQEWGGFFVHGPAAEAIRANAKA